MEREALKLALETAEGIANSDWRKWEELASPEEFERWVKSRALHMATAIKAALAQPAQEPAQEPHEYDWSMLEAAKESLREHMARIKELEAALKQALEALETSTDWNVSATGRQLKSMQAITALRTRLAQPPLPVQPQREWVGLTDEEIAQGNKESWVTKQAWESAVWWASEKLKEKNS